MSGDLPVTLRHGEASLRVRVTPRSGRNAAGGLYLDSDGRAALIVRVSVAPEKGKANEELCAVLARHYGVPVRDVEVIAGAASSRKRVRVRTR